MLDNKLNAYGGFTPAALAPPKMRYHLIRYCVSIAISAGVVCGNRLLSPPASYLCFEFYILVNQKKFYRAFFNFSAAAPAVLSVHGAGFPLRPRQGSGPLPSLHRRSPPRGVPEDNGAPLHQEKRAA